MRTVYFCTEREFPRGDAGANRILHMAKALQMQNWDTKVISLGHAKPEHWTEESGSYIYQSIKYEVVPEFGKGKLARIVRRIIAGNVEVEYLKRVQLNSEDVVIVYSSSYSFCKSIFKYVTKRTEAQLLFDVVEWHQPFQFSTFSTKYIYSSFKKCFDRLYPANEKVIVISERLKKHFEEKGCKVLKLPVYITPDSECSEGSEQKGKMKLIYPGNPYQKDSLEIMLEALSGLEDTEKMNVELHLTGTKRKLLEMSIPGKVDLLDKLVEKGIVIIHEWMDYEELIQLYNSIDFAFIARPNNIVTQSNFPSKVPELLNKGIPPIITSVGDIADYLTDGYDSILIKDCTKESCIAAIRRCLNLSRNEIIQMHHSAKECASEKFDYKVTANRLSDFLTTR